MPSAILLHPARPVNPRGGKSVSEPRFRTLRSARAILAGAFAAFCLTPFAPVLAEDDSGQIQSFLSTLKSARLIDLSHNWEITSPVASVNPFYSFGLTSTHANTRGAFGDGGQLSFTAEVQHFSGQHGAPSPLPATFEITAAHLEQAAKRQRVKLKKGDTVFIRTGWGQHFKANTALYSGANSPGPSLDGANFLIKNGARVVGDDTLTFEQRPPVVTSPTFQVFPVHMRVIADSGVYIIENLNLEELSAAKAYEFVAVVPPLRILGGTGSALRAFALVPRDD